MRDLSFHQIERWLNEHERDAITPAVAQAFSIVILLTALGTGVTSAVVGVTADLLAIKAELAMLAQSAVAWLKGKNALTPSERTDRMKIAYGLIACSAFFDVIERRMPGLLKSFTVTENDKPRLIKLALASRQKAVPVSISDELSLWEAPLLPFPHPTEDWDQQKRELLSLYEQLGKALSSFLPCMAAWDRLDHADRENLQKHLLQLSEECLASFESQYTSLAADCLEFRVWAHRQEYIAAQTHFDLGMRQLQVAIDSIYGQATQRISDDVVSTIRSRYLKLLDSPLMRESEVGENVAPGLTFPNKSSIFVPQRFKAVRYEPGMQIGDDRLWEGLPVRDDLPHFLFSYLESPFSQVAPLVILGHPGSGKSLLTEILCARLSGSPFLPIRVVLRGVTADGRIVEQIDEQLANDVQPGVSWGHLRRYFSTHPTVVVFDGYDELLQATGRIFANYLLDAQEFQREEADRGSIPPRVIVTSRLNLIDKARIPKGTTVLRLLPFDREQRTRWIAAWNLANEDNFRTWRRGPFALSESPAVVELAEQPLLLLMLALYSVYGSVPEGQALLNRTSLYSDLVTVFLRRERHKDRNFRNLTDAEQNSLLNLDRRRLGVCALGMFNRDSLTINGDELDRDLEAFKVALPEHYDARTLSDAESLFGRFFFIHSSRAKDAAKSVTVQRVAYEFLHNTFGEYLCADMLVQTVLAYAMESLALKKDPRLRSLSAQYSEDPARLGTEWYCAWMYTPLCLRPTILEMVAEISDEMWTGNSTVDVEPSELVSEIEILIDAHLRNMIGGNRVPTAIFAPSQVVGYPMPAMTHIATYTLNLILVRCTLTGDSFELPRGWTSGYRNSGGAWERLVYFWLASLSKEAVESLGAIMGVEDSSGATRLHYRRAVKRSDEVKGVDAIERLCLPLFEAIRAEAAKRSGYAAASVVHQLKNQIFSIMHRAERTAQSEGGIREPQMERLNHDLKRLAYLVDGIRDIESVAQGQLRIRPRTVQVSEIVEPALQILASQAESAGIRLSTAYPGDALVLADARLLQQVIVIVGENAIEASRPQSMITIDGRVERDHVTLAIKDRGHGMSPENVSRVFEPGFSKRSRGMGMGLYLASRIMQASGGLIKIESSFDEGTTVEIVFPIAGPTDANTDEQTEVG